MTDTTDHNPQPTAPKVYAAIAAVMAEIAREGVAKSRNNQQQGYKFRGIDDVYNALSGPLARAGLVMLPRVIERSLIERKSAKGTPLFTTYVEMEFDLISAEDGSRHTIRTHGEAMDMADKSTNKAMSAAYKYAAMQAFCIPTEGDNDADAHTPELAAEADSDAPRASNAPRKMSAAEAKKSGVWPEWQKAIDSAGSREELEAWWKANKEQLKGHAYEKHALQRVQERIAQIDAEIDALNTNAAEDNADQ